MSSANTNLTNLTLQRNLNTNSKVISTTIERLSSGCKINFAKDDAAYYSISTKMQNKIAGLNIANDNVSQGVDLTTTLDGALSSITEQLQQMRVLAVEAANGTYSDSERAMMQEEVNQLSANIQNIQDTTSYNNINLFKEKNTSGHKTADELDAEYGAGNWTAITNESELKNMAKGNASSGKVYVLMGDITLSSWTNKWNSSSNAFKGTLDGNNYKISNLTISTSGSYQGLLGYTNSATIKDLTLANVNIRSTSGNYIGGLTGYADNTSITNCSVSGTVSSAGFSIGGLVGYAYSTTTISNSFSSANISISDRNDGAGGLVGKNSGNINNCYSKGNVNGIELVGGLVGGNTGNISNSYAQGNISGTTEVGGLAGENTGTILNSYSQATVTRTSGTNTYFGALYGRNDSGYAPGTITNCHAMTQPNSYAQTTQTGTELHNSAWFNTNSNWSGLGSAYNYDYNPPQLKSNLENKPSTPVTPTPVDAKTISIQIGSDSGNNDVITLGKAGKIDASIDISSAAAAENAIATIDNLIKSVSQNSSEIGTKTNILSSIYDSNMIKVENYEATRSTIMDTDYAKSTAELSKEQILQATNINLIAQTKNIDRKHSTQIITDLGNTLTGIKNA